MQRDLDFIYHQILDNHPGIHNPEDPDFRSFLSENYKKYSQVMSSLQAEGDQQQAIDQFTKEFNDGHLGIEWHENSESKTKQSLEFSITHLTPTIVWVKIPTFNLSSDQKVEFDKILYELKTFHQKSAIIFDLRGNKGGNSYFGRKIMHSLFGKEYVEYHTSKLVENCCVDWRASPGNLDHIKELYKKYNLEWLKAIMKGIENSIKLNRPYYRKYFEYVPVVRKYDLKHNLNAHIIPVIDHKNASAVLDFLDDLKAMQHPMTLVGQETKGDRLYMELRAVELPSGTGKFGFPIKVYRNRLRGDNEPYSPEILYTGDMSNTGALKQFILSEVIEVKRMAG